MKDIERHIRQRGLVPVNDPDSGKKTYRLETAFPIDPLFTIDDKLSDFLNTRRETARLTREEMSELVGLTQNAYGRYERRLSTVKVSRLIHFIELLGIDMLDFLYIVAPQIFGKDEPEAKAREELLSIIMALPTQNMFEVSIYLRSLSQIIEAEKLESDREIVRELKEVLEKSNMTNAELIELVAVQKAKRPTRKYTKKNQRSASEGPSEGD